MESRVMQRTTLRLTSPHLLRGTTPLVLFQRCGHYLSNSSGDEQTYCKSFQVDKLNIFLSHSWSANWRHKFLALFFHFNGVKLIIVSWCVMLFMDRFRRSDGWEDEMAYHNVNSRSEVFWELGIMPFTLAIASTTLALILAAGWYRFTSAFNLFATTIFLDKVCIHQTDATEKKRGIQSIGAVLAASQQMLVAWDKSYLTRMWCTYEIAAFVRARPHGRIVLVPIKIGTFLALMYMAAFATAATDSPGLAYFLGWAQSEISILCWFVFGTILTLQSLSFNEELHEMHRQISSFSVSESMCFCCSCQHVHPDTGADIPCDRALVYESIRHWYANGGSTAEGLEKFNHHVHKLQKLRVHVSFSLVIVICQPFGIVALLELNEFQREMMSGYFLWHVAEILEFVLLRLPLVIRATLWLTPTVHALISRRLASFPIISYGCTVLCTVPIFTVLMQKIIQMNTLGGAIYYMSIIREQTTTDYRLWEPQTLFWFVVFCIETLLVYIVYFRYFGSAASAQAVKELELREL